MDATTVAKSIAGLGVMACAMILALTGKIDGNQAMAAVSAVGGVYIAGQAFLGGSKAIADGMTRRSSAAPVPSITRPAPVAPVPTPKP